jgi:hypothetical protein
MLDQLDKHLERRTYLLRIEPSKKLIEAVKEFKRLIAKRPADEIAAAVALVNDLVVIEHRVRIDDDKSGFLALAQPSTEMMQMINVMQFDETKVKPDA